MKQNALNLKCVFHSYNKDLISKSYNLIKDLSKKMKITPSGLLGIKRKKSLYTVLRSPVGDKKSREQFYMYSHKSLCSLQFENSKQVQLFVKACHYLPFYGTELHLISRWKTKFKIN